MLFSCQRACLRAKKQMDCSIHNISRMNNMLIFFQHGDVSHWLMFLQKGRQGAEGE